MFDITALDGGVAPLKPGPVCPAELMADMEAIYGERAEARGLVFKCEVAEGTPETVQLDPRVFAKLAIHMIGNAVKFTSDGEIAVSVEALEGQRLRLTVNDTGPGLSVAEQALVFEPFERTATARRLGAPGAGVGLALCRRLAEHADGRIGVESEPGRGSIFWVELPFRTPEASAG